MLSRFISTIKLIFWSLSSKLWDEQAATRAYIEPVLEIVHTHLAESGKHLLDLGCGTGIYAVAFAEKGYDVIGVDGATGMLAHAYPRITPQLATRLRFELVNVDGRLPYADETFDACLAISVLQALAHPAKTSQEVWRILKPGAVFVVLHSGRPPHLALPLPAAIRRRIHFIKQKTVLNIVMASIKTIGEKYGGTRYWTATELTDLLQNAGFAVEPLTDTAVMIAVARKTTLGMCTESAGDFHQEVASILRSE